MNGEECVNDALQQQWEIVNIELDTPFQALGVVRENVGGGIVVKLDLVGSNKRVHDFMFANGAVLLYSLRNELELLIDQRDI